MRNGLAYSRNSEQHFCEPYFLSMLAQNLALCGQIEAGLEAEFGGPRRRRLGQRVPGVLQ